MMAELDILNGFAGKVISDCIDIAIDKIKKADKNRKDENQTIETRIYQVTIDALNKFPYNKYKKEEKVYDAAESILKELKRGNRIYKEAVRAGLNMLSSEVTEDICKDFLELLCYEICRKENRDLAIGHIIHQGEKISEWQQQMDRHLQEGLKESRQNEKEILDAARDIKCSLEGMNEGKSCKTVYESPVVNRAEEYAQKWNRNVFLNDFNKRDKDAGINIKLKDIYLEEHLPHYVWKANEEPLDDLKTLLREYITDKDDKQILLILGQPGIGKSTLITWIMANLVEKKDDIYVYQFASDLKNINWQGEGMLNEILEKLNLEYEELENKALILDGFDEIQANGDREKILNKLNQELDEVNSLEKFSLIITCRENYVNPIYLVGYAYITLQAWNTKQIRSFCKIYERSRSKHNSENSISRIPETKIEIILENKEIFGIPLILYMILALDVTIEKNESIVDIYDQIFSLNRGGIYDRCIKNSKYGSEHRISETKIKKQIHQISQRTAFWIFENNPEKGFIYQKDFKNICDGAIKSPKRPIEIEDIQRDVLIGSYFEPIKHCEGVGTDELHFIHRSIYEYFVAVFIFESVYKLDTKEKITGMLGILLKDGYLSRQILEFIKCKFEKLKTHNLPYEIKDILQTMLQDGMTYRMGIPCRNALNREINIFINMIKMVFLWNPELGKVDSNISFYIKCNKQEKLNLRGIKLENVNLCQAYLFQADLCGANLEGADLKGADLREANLSKTNLRGANLDGADLRGADLRDANLNRVHLNNTLLNEADLRGADLYGGNLEGASWERTILDEVHFDFLGKKYYLVNSLIYLSKKNMAVNYYEYCPKRDSGEEDSYLYSHIFLCR
ncbi:MAG: pentapeptide repeat-containing protein [Lachnospiraceae bacterium]|nr:pentapeptide repeat-containing protein [Lachnospiraceae bacterium]